MSFSLLKKAINEQKNEGRDIFLLAFLLGDSKIRMKKTWNGLAESFFEYYRESIFRYCGYDTGPLNLERIRVKEPKLFIEYMSGMYRYGMFENCSYEELAEFIHMVFQTGHEKNHVCNMLKEAHEEYQHIHEAIKREIKKEIQKRERNN